MRLFHRVSWDNFSSYEPGPVAAILMLLRGPLFMSRWSSAAFGVGEWQGWLLVF